MPLAGGATAATSHAPAAPATQLKLTQLTQDQDQWCWVASGLTIAQFLGKGTNIDENTFCVMARNLQEGSQCPNEAGELSYDQTAFSKLGMNPGQEGQALSYDDIKTQIDAGKPIETGIMWTAGGGHAQVIYGYNESGQTLNYGDPWPASPRYAEMAVSEYTSNGQFNWAASLYGEG